MEQLMDDGRWLVWIAGIFVLLRLMPFLATIPVLLRMRLRPVEATEVEETAVDPQVAAWLREAAAPLVEAGFEEAGFAAVRDGMSAPDDPPEIQIFLLHPETGTFAQIMPAQIPDFRLPWRIDFDTPLSDGGFVTTVNAMGHMVIGKLPGDVINDASCLTQRELWEAHREKLRTLAPPRRMRFEEFLRKTEERSADLHDHLRSQGVVRPDGERGSALRLAPAARMAWRMARGNTARERFLSQRAQEIQSGRVAPQAVEPWQEVSAYLRMQRALRNPVSPGALVAIFVASGLAFALGLSWVFGLAGVVCLLAVVAFHELGHYAAMRLFGYRDTSIFFVPFLGAATTGKKEDASLSQEIVVFLAGPLPGIALGVFLIWLRPESVRSGWELQLVAMLLGLNVLNLFPVMPLDGGKVMERVFLAGRPWGALVVSGLGVLGFVALAAWARDPVLLVFCAFFALSLRSHFRAMRLLKRAKSHAISAATEEERAEATFAALSEGGPVAFGRKVGLARLVESHWIRAPGTALGRACWLAVYVVLLVGCVGVGALGISRASPATAEVEPEALPAHWLDASGAEPVSCEAPVAPDSLLAIGGEETWDNRLLLVCDTDPETARTLHVQVHDFATLDGGYVSCSRPPWRMDALAPDERARISRDRAAFLEIARRDLAFTQEIVDRETDPEALARARREHLLREAGEPASPDTAAILDLFLEVEVAADYGRYEELEQRMGEWEPHCPADGDPVHEVVLAHDREAGRVRLALQVSDPEESFETVVGYLCAAGCRVRQRSGPIEP